MHALGIVCMLLYVVDGNQIEILEKRIIFLQSKHDLDMSILRGQLHRQIEEISSKQILEKPLSSIERGCNCSIEELNSLKQELSEERRMRMEVEAELQSNQNAYELELIHVKEWFRRQEQANVMLNVRLNNTVMSCEQQLQTVREIESVAQGKPHADDRDRIRTLESRFRAEKMLGKRSRNDLSLAVRNTEINIANAESSFSKGLKQLRSEITHSLVQISENITRMQGNLSTTWDKLTELFAFKTKFQIPQTRSYSTLSASQDTTDKPVVCINGYTLHEKYSLCYKVSLEAKLFENGRLDCENEGTDLIMFSSRDEIQDVAIILAEYDHRSCCMSVGFREIGATKQFHWLNGTHLPVLPFTTGGLWDSNEGSNSGSQCGCIYLTRNKWLADCFCSFKLHFVCGYHL